MGDPDMELMPSESISLLDTLIKTKNSVASRVTYSKNIGIATFTVQ